MQDDGQAECGGTAVASVVSVWKRDSDEQLGVDAEHSGDLAEVREEENGDQCGGADEVAEA